MPDWVTQAYQDYVKRLPPDFNLQLVEVEPAQRGKNRDVRRVLQQEEEKILKAIPHHSLVVALAIQGQAWDTLQLTEKLREWRMTHPQICFLVGGPEGLSEGCLKKSHIKWSLSPLTLPHPLVRVLLAEQLYRTYTLITQHPYHR